jgi:hypothetical protein
LDRNSEKSDRLRSLFACRQARRRLGVSLLALRVSAFDCVSPLCDAVLCVSLCRYDLHPDCAIPPKAADSKDSKESKLTEAQAATKVQALYRGASMRKVSCDFFVWLIV